MRQRTVAQTTANSGAKHNEADMGTSARITPPEKVDGGMTYVQAMEAMERWFVYSQAAPTISQEMAIPLDTIAALFGAKIWPSVRKFWMDRVLP